MTGGLRSGSDATDPVGADGASFRTWVVEVGHGVRLKVLHWRPNAPPSLPRIVFVAGWVSVVEGWAKVLRALAPVTEVVYLETREKPSAGFSGRRLRPADFTLSRLAEDIVEACAALAVDDGSSVFFASSMGANAVLEALAERRLSARAAFLVAPNGEFRYPWWGHVLVRMPAAGYRAALPLVLAYLRHARVNATADPGQMQRYERTLRSAEPLRLKLSAIANAGYRAPADLCEVKVPVAVAYASSDTLHGGCRCEELVAALPRGTLIRCPTNTFMHDVEIVAELTSFLAAIEPEEDR